MDLETIRSTVLHGEDFVELRAKGKIRGGESRWRQIEVRPVMIKQEKYLQFVYYDARQSFTHNFLIAEAGEPLDELLAIPFSSLHLITTEQMIHFQRTKKGRLIPHITPRMKAEPLPDLAHDHQKDLPLPEGAPNAVLKALGIMTAEGQVKANRRSKFTQINEFIKLMEHTGYLDTVEHQPLNILDCGCGSSYLTLATYDYLNRTRGLSTALTGVDVNEKLMQKNRKLVQELGYGNIEFYASSIADYTPTQKPDIVIALHACDTATDEALAVAVQNDADLILCAPCCHNHLQQQMQVIDPFRPVQRHGILNKRLGDLLTDSFRALILRIYGYKAEVIEFISPEHTDRNLMIRAIKRAAPGEKQFIDEYQALKSMWQVTPYLETLLEDSFTALLNDSAE